MKKGEHEDRKSRWGGRREVDRWKKREDKTRKREKEGFILIMPCALCGTNWQSCTRSETLKSRHFSQSLGERSMLKRRWVFHIWLYRHTHCWVLQLMWLWEFFLNLLFSMLQFYRHKGCNYKTCGGYLMLQGLSCFPKWKCLSRTLFTASFTSLSLRLEMMGFNIGLTIL